MNLAHRSRYLTMVSCLAFVTLAGCAEYKAENPALTEYPGIQSQIENFYDANAIEDDWACDSPQMQGIDRSKVGGQTASQVRMAIAYYFRSTALQEGQGRLGKPAATSSRSAPWLAAADCAGSPCWWAPISLAAYAALPWAWWLVETPAGIRLPVRRIVAERAAAQGAGRVPAADADL